MFDVAARSKLRLMSGNETGPDVVVFGQIARRPASPGR